MTYPGEQAIARPMAHARRDEPRRTRQASGRTGWTSAGYAPRAGSWGLLRNDGTARAGIGGRARCRVPGAERGGASDGAGIAMLRALAPDLAIAFETAGDAPRALAALERERWAEVVPPVVIGWDGAIDVPFSVPAALDDTWEIEVLTEAGATLHAHGRLFALPADGHAW